MIKLLLLIFFSLINALDREVEIIEFPIYSRSTVDCIKGLNNFTLRKNIFNIYVYKDGRVKIDYLKLNNIPDLEGIDPFTWIVDEFTYNEEHIGDLDLCVYEKSGTCQELTQIYRSLLELKGEKYKVMTSTQNGEGHMWLEVKGEVKDIVLEIYNRTGKRGP